MTSRNSATEKTYTVRQASWIAGRKYETGAEVKMTDAAAEHYVLQGLLASPNAPATETKSSRATAKKD